LEVLDLATKGPMSANMAYGLIPKATIAVISYHSHTLAKLGCLELARTQQKRGAVEHFYLPTDRGRRLLRIAEEIVKPPDEEEEEAKDDDPSN
jgi:hypothetical protein